MSGRLVRRSSCPVEADLAARQGNHERAAALFRAAADRVPGEAERRALLGRARPR
ncbi:hypothetical protein KIF24_31820 [Micromonospora sp. Llam7]|uniref:hypothetical protein n=1 Tax=Micromonospora tarapacensis TaxID=2835305 RepID=UPI001C835E9A|nr:hypothetical protein [Micromonospora tarapacensis]MBX7270161.1 hypothetical protein [Micromonospora tarapacensis]